MEPQFNLIDTLTRVLAAPPATRPLWRVAAGTALAGIWTLFGDDIRQPQSLLAQVSDGCLVLNADTSCPPNTDKRTKPGNQPTANGCGPEGGSIKIPQGYGDADYTSSCNSHDFCYEDCAGTKDNCDEVFRDDMYNACAAAYPGTLNGLLRFGCYERAYVYYQAVSQFGADAFTAAQFKACECCHEPEPTMIYCNCNQTCYDDVNVCLDECETSLGCLTGICGPAEAGQCPA